MTSTPVVAVVLAGGRSRRFGSDKLAAVVDGRPMLDAVVAGVRAVTPSVVAVLAPGDDRSVPGGAGVVRDQRPHEGPLAGLAAGLAAIDDTSAIALVVAGDMPVLRPAVLELLVTAVRDGAQGAVLHDGVAPRPLPAAYRVGAATTTSTRLLAEGERRLRALPEALAAHEIPLARWRPLDPEGVTLLDIDRPADLARATGRTGRSAAEEPGPPAG